MGTGGEGMRCERRSAARGVFLQWEKEDAAAVREDEIGWKCLKHPSQPRYGVCPVCLRDRLLRLCPDCGYVRPCHCFASSSSSPSSFSSLPSTERARTAGGAARSDGAGIGVMGTVSRLIECEPAFRRSQSAGFQLLRSGSMPSAAREPPPRPRGGKGWGPLWPFRRADAERQEPVEAKLYRSRSLAAAQPPDAGSGHENGGRGKGLRWNFSSPIKAFRHRKSATKVVLAAERSPLWRGIHAYIVFKDVQYAKAALSLNMTQFGGNHIRIDIACPPRKKLKGEGPLYDRKRTLFVGNLPFDVRDEELYQLFCGASELESNVEAIRVIRDSQTSLGRGIAYVLLKNREAANSMVRKRDWEIRDRILRVCHARSTDGAPSITPTKRKNESRREFPQKKPVVTSEKAKAKGPTPSYQGLRSNKSGALKKSNLQRKPTAQVNHKGKRRGLGESGSDFKATKAKRPAVAARKAKQLLMKRKQEGGTPGDRMHKKGRKS